MTCSGPPFWLMSTLRGVCRLREGGSDGGEDSPLSSSSIDIIEMVESTGNSGYWVCPCWGNSKDQDSILLSNKDVSLQEVS